MKNLTGVLAALLLGAVGFAVVGCSKTEQQSQPAPSEQTNANKTTVQYTCSMHPEVVQNSPGNCPKCGMKLVEKR